MKSLLIKSLIFTILIPGSVAVYLPLTIANEAIITQEFNIFLAAILMGTGLAIYSWCVWDFISCGLGTPAPINVPKRLVTRGLYCFTRNPMYVAVICIIMGWALLFSDLLIVLYGGFITICFHILIVYYEEPKLQKLFGSEYLKYKTIVNRWLPTFTRVK